MEKHTCNICKIRAYIICDQCEKATYFCSRGHLHSHKLKSHSNIIQKQVSSVSQSPIRNNRQEQHENNDNGNIDLRKLFEHLQNMKKEIEIKIKNKNYVEAILIINKSLPLVKKFYQDDDYFVNIINN
jgi:hypothetical protein